jgi:hypothetical protein
MEGKQPRCRRELRVARHFEGSRLERELLAAAYERAFPSVRRARSAGGIGDGHTVRSAPQMDLDERIAMGGR